MIKKPSGPITYARQSGANLSDGLGLSLLVVTVVGAMAFLGWYFGVG